MAGAAQSQPGGGPTWTLKVIHRSPDGSLGAVQEAGSGYVEEVRVARSAAGGTYLSWLGTRRTPRPLQTAIAPFGGGFDSLASADPHVTRTSGTQVVAVGDTLLMFYA